LTAPRIHVGPPSASSYGADAARLARVYLFAPDGWQEEVLSSWLATDATGAWAASRCGLLVPRQNGKNALLEMRELYGLVILGERILHTAHQQKTARKSFNNLVSCFGQKDLKGCVREVYSALGRESVTLANGGAIEYVARTRASARGYTADALVCDEAQYLSDEQYEALVPTISASPLRNPQTIMVGTPPLSATEAEVFGRMRQDALGGTSDGLSWHEWSVDEIGDVADRSRWEAVNPALGTRLSGKVIADELATMSREGFARERLGLWPQAGASALVQPHEWERLKAKAAPDSRMVAYGVKFSLDGTAVALAVALRAEKVHVEVVRYEDTCSGIAWLVEWLSERRRKACAIVIDGLAGANLLAGMLKASKVPERSFRVARHQDAAAAASMLLNAIREGTLSHFGQEVLDAAVLSARRRPIGKSGGWGFGGAGGCDVSPLDAAALAYLGVMTSKRDPTRVQRVL
jgi:hypothetical protein